MKIFEDHYRRCWDKTSSSATLKTGSIEATSILGQGISRARKSLERVGVDTATVDVLGTYGTDAANGHAFLSGRTTVAWFSLEENWSELNAYIFGVHELVHALHYLRQPEFGFHSKTERTSFTRLLITEGLATVASMWACDVELDVALWGDYLSSTERGSWMVNAHEQEVELRALACAAFDSRDEGAFLYTGSSDVWRNRGGYFVGARAVGNIMTSHTMTLPELFQIERMDFELLLRDELN